MNVRTCVAACVAAALWASAAAHAAAPVPAVTPPDAEGHLRIDPADRCPVCHMYAARDPRLAAAVELADGRAFYPCGTGCLFEALEHPEKHLGATRGKVRRVLVQDHATGEPLDATSAWFVSGSDVAGPMGPAPVPLASEAEAAKFRASHGGEPAFRLSERIRAEPQASARGEGEALRRDGPRNAPGRAWHPLLVLVLALHLVGLALLGFAGVGAVRHLSGAEAPSPERHSLAIRSAALLLVLGSLAFVSAIAGAAKSLVPGAMCGTGVLQSMNGEGGKALALQAVALLALGAAWTVDSLRRRSPGSPLAGASSRASLLAFAAQAVASYGTLKAVLALDPDRAVDCCSLVYGRLATGASSARLEGAPLLAAAVALAGLSLSFSALALWRPASRAAAGLGFAALASVPFAGLALLRVVSARWSQPLANECPWCLFLPEHGLLGYPLLAALFVVSWESVAALASRTVMGDDATLAGHAQARTRSAALRVALALVVFAAFAAWPLR